MATSGPGHHTTPLSGLLPSPTVVGLFLVPSVACWLRPQTSNGLYLSAISDADCTQKQPDDGWLPSPSLPMPGAR
jgi:hypothetical protein